MDDCAAFIPNQRMIHGQFMTGNKEIAATGCNPLRDLCMLEWCAPQDDVPVCRIGGPDFVCNVGGQMRNDCTCVQPLYPCNQMDPEVYPGGIVHNCNVRKPPTPRPRSLVAPPLLPPLKRVSQGHGTKVENGMHGCTCEAGWGGACCTEETHNALSGGGH